MLLLTIFAIFIRIFSNSYLNVFQKLLTNLGFSPSNINFYTYLGLTIISYIFLSPNFYFFNNELLFTIIAMGILGALGNYFIIKALSLGELSSLAPINSYKPVIAILAGFVFLNEIPSLNSFFGLILIIIGTCVIYGVKSNIHKFAIFYRILALIFSGLEAIFIKRVILLTNISEALFYWSIAGLVFSFLFITVSKKKLKPINIKYQFLLIVSVGLMQYSTNFVFSKMNVANALALFQLSTLVSVFLGINLFNEKDFRRKIFASFIMIIGAIIIILN